MADTNNLTNFLGDVADAIRAKTGNNDPIPAANFDTEIANIATGTELPDGIYIQNVTPIKNTVEAFWLYEISGDKASDLIPPETMIGASISFGQIKSALIDQNLLNDFDAAYYHVFAVSYGGNYASVAFSNNAYRVYSSYSANQTYVGNGTANVCVCNFAVNNANPNHLIFNNQGQVGYWSNANYQSWGIDFCDKDILYSNGVLWRAADELGTNQDGLSINVGNEQYVVYQSEAGINTFSKILNSQGMNATSNDIIFGKTAIANNQKITGNMQQYSIDITPSMVTQTINNGYHTNSQINSISVSNEYINWINTSENILGTTVSRYNALEYLQGNNTQRINTGYIPSANTSIEINIYKPSNSSYISWERVFSAGQGNFEVMRDNTSNQFIFHGSHGIIAGRFNIANNTFYTLKINNGALYLNNVRQFTFNQNSIMGDALNLFHGGDRNSGFRVYSCKIYDNDTLQMDLHPAKDANNIACMYDRISGNYLYETNMKNFIAGPETNTLLNDVLDTMQSEKTTKIVPQNIANGITIFGITGNLVGGENLDNELNAQNAVIANLQNEVNILSDALNNAAQGSGADLKIYTGTTEPNDYNGIWFNANINYEDVLIRASNSIENPYYIDQVNDPPYGLAAPIAGSSGSDAYIFGTGFDMSNAQSACVYNTMTDTYELINSLPEIMSSGSGGICVNNNCYLFGSNAYKYDIANDTYTQLNAFPNNYFAGGQITNIGNEIYMFGQINGSMNLAYKYNIDTDTYTQLNDIPYRPSFMGMYAPIAIGDNIYLFGLNTGDEAVIYNSLTDTYNICGNNIPESFVGATVARGNKIYLISSNNIHEYNTIDDTYFTSFGLSHAFTGSPAVLADNGNYTDLLMLGGFESPNIVQKLVIPKGYKDNSVIITTEYGTRKTNLTNSLNIEFAEAYLYSDEMMQTFNTYYGNGTNWVQFMSEH